MSPKESETKFYEKTGQEITLQIPTLEVTCWVERLPFFDFDPEEVPSRPLFLHGILPGE